MQIEKMSHPCQTPGQGSRHGGRRAGAHGGPGRTFSHWPLEIISKPSIVDNIAQKIFVIAAGRDRARTRAPQSVLLRVSAGTGRQAPHGWAESTSRRNPAKTRQQNAGHTQPGQQHNRIHVHYKLQDNGRLQHQPE